jgi:hypothetical protein
VFHRWQQTEVVLLEVGALDVALLGRLDRFPRAGRSPASTAARSWVWQ